jgi:hypothetical protein
VPKHRKAGNRHGTRVRRHHWGPIFRSSPFFDPITYSSGNKIKRLDTITFSDLLPANCPYWKIRWANLYQWVMWLVGFPMSHMISTVTWPLEVTRNHLADKSGCVCEVKTWKSYLCLRGEKKLPVPPCEQVRMDVSASWKKVTCTTSQTSQDASARWKLEKVTCTTSQASQDVSARWKKLTCTTLQTSQDGCVRVEKQLLVPPRKQVRMCLRGGTSNFFLLQIIDLVS